MHRRRGKAAFLMILLAGVLASGGACLDDEDQLVKIDDLLGTWEGATLEGAATLTFAIDGGIRLYEFKALPGEFAEDLEPGASLLSGGRWDLQRTTLYLWDDVEAPFSCPVTDRYDIMMNGAKTVLVLSWYAGECQSKGRVIDNASWTRLPEAGEEG